MRLEICENNMIELVKQLRQAAAHLNQVHHLMKIPADSTNSIIHQGRLESWADYFEQIPPFNYETPKSNNPAS